MVIKMFNNKSSKLKFKLNKVPLIPKKALIMKEKQLSL